MSPSAPSDAAARAARDAELIRRLRAGDERALDALVQLYAEPLVRAAAVVTNTHDLAQDAAQDVFCWLWDTRATLEVRGSVLSYLVRAVRNRAVSLLRHERAEYTVGARESLLRGTLGPSAADAEEADAERAAFFAALEAALQQLRPRTREIFLLHADLGMSYAEIEDALGVGRATIHNQMSLAVKALRPLLEAWRRPL